MTSKPGIHRPPSAGPSDTVELVIAPVTYAAMRLRWCRAVLDAFVRRWGAYLLMAAAMIGGATANSGEVVSAATAMVVLPLYAAASRPVWLAPAVVAYAAGAAMLVLAARSLLWPASWGPVERALPIAGRDRMRSDSHVVVIALLPVLLPCAAGAWALHDRHPAWALGTSGLVMALLLSVVFGVVVLQSLRRHRRPWLDRFVAVCTGQRSGRLASHHAHRTEPDNPLRRTPWWWVLCVLPLWRGPARRTGAVMLWGMLALCALTAALAIWPNAAAWWFAAHATGVLLVTTRANRLARDELASLTSQFAVLPIPPARPRQAIAALVMAPALAMTTAMAVTASLHRPATALRPGMLAAYCAVCLVGCAIEVFTGRHDPATKSMRWMLSWVVMLALASEVMSA